MRYFKSGNPTTRNQLGLAYTAPSGARLAAVVLGQGSSVKGIYEYPEGTPTPYGMVEEEFFGVLIADAAANAEALRRHYGQIEIIADPGVTTRGYGGYVKL